MEEIFRVIKAGDPGWYQVAWYMLPEAEEFKPYICSEAKPPEWWNIDRFERIVEVTDPMKGFPKEV